MKRPGLASGLFRFKFLQFFLLGIEQIEDFIVEVFGKAQRTLAILRHATLQREITKVCETKKLSFLLTETKNLPDQVRVIVLAAVTDGAAAFPDFFPQRIILGVLHDRIHRGKLLGEAPLALLAFCFGIFRCAGLG